MAQSEPRRSAGSINKTVLPAQRPRYRGGTRLGFRFILDRNTIKRQLILTALFVSSGIAALSSKLSEELGPAQENLHFQAVLFTGAFITAFVGYYRKKEGASQHAFPGATGNWEASEGAPAERGT
jgi:hypothetical protein